MTVTVADARPQGLDVPFRPGNTFPVELTWPNGHLAGRTFTSTLNGVTLAMAINGDVMIIEATEAQTAAVETPATWLLTETTGGATNDLLIGTWSPSTRPGTPTSLALTVIVDGVQVDVTVASGQASIVALDARVDQAETDIVALEATDVTLDGRLDTVEGSLTSHGTRLTTAEADIDALQAVDTSLDGRLDTIEPALASTQAALTAHEAEAPAEARGAAVEQAAAALVEARWLAYVRESGGAADKNFLGGDVTDVFMSTGSTSPAWIGSDWFDGTTIDTDDTYGGTALPVRNGCVIESPPGVFSQIYRVPSSGIWLDAVADGGLVSGHHWWPIAGLHDAGTNRIACWYVDNSIGPWGGLVDTHIVTLNGFGLYASHVACGIGSVTDNLWVEGLLRDDTHTYIYGVQFVPDFDADVANNGSVPNYGIGDDLTGHHTLTRVGRVTNGQLTTVASWEYWNGTAWVSGVTNAAPMVDVDGVQIRGDAGVTKLGTGRYLLAAHRLVDSHVAVYTGSAPQGPWTLIARVPAPTQGETIGGGTQIGQLTKILPPSVAPAPPEHSIVMLSRNLLFPTAAWADRNIRRYAPQFVVVPHA